MNYISTLNTFDIMLAIVIASIIILTAILIMCRIFINTISWFNNVNSPERNPFITFIMVCMGYNKKKNVYLKGFGARNGIRSPYKYEDVELIFHLYSILFSIGVVIVICKYFVDIVVHISTFDFSIINVIGIIVGVWFILATIINISKGKFLFKFRFK